MAVVQLLSKQRMCESYSITPFGVEQQNRPGWRFLSAVPAAKCFTIRENEVDPVSFFCMRLIALPLACAGCLSQILNEQAFLFEDKRCRIILRAGERCWPGNSLLVMDWRGRRPGSVDAIAQGGCLQVKAGVEEAGSFRQRSFEEVESRIDSL